MPKASFNTVPVGAKRCELGPYRWLYLSPSRVACHGCEFTHESVMKEKIEGTARSRDCSNKRTMGLKETRKGQEGEEGDEQGIIEMESKAKRCRTRNDKQSRSGSCCGKGQTSKDTPATCANEIPGAEPLELCRTAFTPPPHHIGLMAISETRYR